ncbi:MAG: hypothetical protein Q8K85_21755 [Hyphomicrobium sp.]|nr:hypothetical protein [Hyphomicrobium sp.]
MDGIAEAPLSFRGAGPILHSAANHRHLWALNAAADRDRSFDLAFRCRVVAHILERWRARLVSHATSSPHGFRLYLYEDLAPTVSVVAETPLGCPYGGDLTFVATIGEVLAAYDGRSWTALFEGGGPKPDVIVNAVSHASGSLRAGAQRMGMPLARFRRLIETFDLAGDINRIRKHNGRRPARFADCDALPPKLRIWDYAIAPR